MMKGKSMPRINVEEVFFTDPRLTKMALKMSSFPMAVGCCVLAWRQAQTYWRVNKKGLPLPVFNQLEGAAVMLEVGLAFLTSCGEFVYFAGSKEQFDWLKEREEAGRRGGISKSANGRAPVMEITEENFKQNVANASKRKQTLPSSSYSSSDSKKEEDHVTSPNGSVTNDSPFFNQSIKPPFEDSPQKAVTPPSELLRIWNENCAPLPQALKLTETRRKAARRRLNEVGDLAYWAEVVKRLAASRFCQGDKGWRADFDFLIRPETHTKVMEGKYDNPGGYNAQRATHPEVSVEELLKPTHVITDTRTHAEKKAELDEFMKRVRKEMQSEQA
jgi:hypothetical protein